MGALSIQCAVKQCWQQPQQQEVLQKQHHHDVQVMQQQHVQVQLESTYQSIPDPTCDLRLVSSQ